MQYSKAWKRLAKINRSTTALVFLQGRARATRWKRAAKCYREAMHELYAANTRRTTMLIGMLHAQNDRIRELESGPVRAVSFWVPTRGQA